MGLIDALQQIVDAAAQNASRPAAATAQETSGAAKGSGATASGAHSGMHANASGTTGPALAELIGQLYAQLTPTQRAGFLNQLIQTLGPAAATALAGGVLQKIVKPGQSRVNPGATAALTPAEVTRVVDEAQNAGKPDLAQLLSSFYAEHATLIHTVGGLALVAAAAKLKDYLQRR